MATPSITIKKGFRHAAEFFGPGREAALLASNPQPTAEQLANWQKRDLIEMDGAASPETHAETAVLQMLKPYVGERGNPKEDEAEVLLRIIRERDDTDDRLEDLAELLGNSLEVSREKDETALSFLERVIEKGLSESKQQDLTASTEDAEVEAQSFQRSELDAPTSAPAITTPLAPETPVTAEELTKTLGNAKVALALLNAGFNTREKLTAASDTELDAIEGVGTPSVAKIREFLAA